jgi:hypothetical protein
MVNTSKSKTFPVTAPGPLAEYGRRTAEGEALADRLAARSRSIFRTRTVFLGLIVGVAWLAEKERLLPALLSLPVVVFISAVLEKNRVWRAWQRMIAVVRFYQRRLANLEDRWAGTGEQGSRFLHDAHPYARDLDLFGPGSLFERLHLAGTPLGEEVLAAWLLAPAGVAEVRARQAAVAELRDRLDLREDLSLLGQQARGAISLDTLTTWAAAPTGRHLRLARLSSAAFRMLTVLTGLGCFLGLGPVPFLGALLLAGVVAISLWQGVQRSLPTLAIDSGELRPLHRILARLQRERFASPLLCRAQSALAIRSLRHLVRLLDAVPLAPLAFPVLGSGQLAMALEGWRVRHGLALANWLATLGQLEALNALAAYAYENPADPFPELLDQGLCFEAEGLGHPLLPAATCVRNDLSLNAEQRLLIVSGSNMSGKSTLLRTVGVNAVLALCGAPVRAAHLRLSSLMPGATLRLEDSLLEGRSRFFAEVTRVRQLLDLARTQPPLLFLLDELFSGTNSDDRRQGAEAVVRRLLDWGSIGLLTTHDLALMHLAEVLGPRASNVHFTDQFVDGTMTFDYRMHSGALRSGNGLALMRAVGIEV